MSQQTAAEAESIPFVTAQSHVGAFIRDARRTRPYGGRSLHVSIVVGQTEADDALGVFMRCTGPQGYRSLSIHIVAGVTLCKRYHRFNLDGYTEGVDAPLRSIAKLDEHLVWIGGPT